MIVKFMAILLKTVGDHATEDACTDLQGMFGFVFLGYILVLGSWCSPRCEVLKSICGLRCSLIFRYKKISLTANSSTNFVFVLYMHVARHYIQSHIFFSIPMV